MDSNGSISTLFPLLNMKKYSMYIWELLCMLFNLHDCIWILPRPLFIFAQINSSFLAISIIIRLYDDDCLLWSQFYALNCDWSLLLSTCWKLIIVTFDGYVHTDEYIPMVENFSDVVITYDARYPIYVCYNSETLR